MPLIPRHRPPLGRLATVLALVGVVGAPLAVGAVHAPMVVALAALSLLALSLDALDRMLAGRSLRTSWFALPFGIGLLATAFTLLPLPLALREWLSSASTERVTWVTALLSDENRALVRPVLSLDPSETALALLRLISALGIFVVIADRCRRRETRQLAYRILLGGALALFLVALGHRLAHVPLIWGAFKAGTTPLYAPLVNPNHLARAFGAFSLLCLGRALTVRSRTESFWFGIGGVVCGAGVLLTLSRGGILVYLVVLAAFGALLWRTSTAVEADDASPASRKLIAVLASQMAGLLALAIGLFVAHEAIVKELGTLGAERIETSKAFLYPLALRLVGEHWSVGVGNNAFGAAFPSVAAPGELPRYGTFSHAENLVVQTLVDHGIIIGTTLLALGLVILGVLVGQLRSRASLGPIAVLVFLVLGDLFDFALETGFGIALAATALGLASAELLHEGRTEIRVPRRALVGGLAALLGLFLLGGVIALNDDRRALDADIAAEKGDGRTGLIERALARHPSDAYYAYLLSTEARERRDARAALQWANRALVLWPGHRDAHVEVARVLAASGHLDQALLEYRLAWQSGPGAYRALLLEVARRTPDVALRRRAIPGNDPSALAQLCEVLVHEKRLDDAQPCFDEAAAMPGADAKVPLRAVQIALARKDGPGAASRLAPLLENRAPDGQLAALAAEAHALEHGPEVALALTDAWLARAARPRELLKWRLTTALRLGNTVEAQEAVARLRRIAVGAREVDWLDRMEADMYAKRGELGRALQLWRRIASRAPKDVGALLRQGSLELGLEMLHQAEDSYGRARRLAPERPDVISFGKRIEAARKRAAETKMKDWMRDATPR